MKKSDLFIFSKFRESKRRRLVAEQRASMRINECDRYVTKTNLKEGIGVVLENRTVEETGGGDDGEVQDVIADRDARSSR